MQVSSVCFCRLVEVSGLLGMGMFDSYKPSSNLNCPVCGEKLAQWQGKNGPCALFVWQEGSASPIDQQAGDTNCSIEQRASNRLPKEFEIYSYDCNCPYPNEAICTTEDGIWSKTAIVNSNNILQKKHERKSEFKLRLNWITSNEI